MRRWLLLAITVPLLAQDRVTIQVNAARSLGSFRPIYRYFGYDEPNYTYMNYGRKLIGELAALSAEPVYLRTHFLLATGDGNPAFKWGSTNVYTEDAHGTPVYNWTLVDRILDTYLEAGAKPFVEIGFMPKALSTHPEPYPPQWEPGAKFDKYYVGWTYPPADYAKWGELVYQWVRHCVQKYSAAEVQSWYWEVWNEPDIGYWHGTPEEYNRLYDYAAKAVKRALPSARVGGPATTGPANAKAAAYLRQFLEHCDVEAVPLDFITYHAKGRPEVVEGHVRMGISKNAEDVAKGLEIVASFPKYKNLPIILSESDPEGCAACSARVYPQNAYRNGPLYPAYTAAMLDTILKLAGIYQSNVEGMLTWAFEFEGQPYFDGFRTLATNGIDKPILNLFRMAGLLRGERISVESSAGIPLEGILASGVRSTPYVSALAVRSERRIAVLAWNYHDEDVPAPDAAVTLNLKGIPQDTPRLLMRRYRIDQTHSNAYAVWKLLGSPQSPTPEQYARLESAGRLEPLDSPTWLRSRALLQLDFRLPRQGVSLLEFTW